MLSKSPRQVEKRKYEKWIILYKNTIIDKTSTEESLTDALRETEFEDQNESEQNSFFG